jgi:hypothetical protein
MPKQTLDAPMHVRDRQRLRCRRQHLDGGALDLAVAESSGRRLRRGRWQGAWLDRLIWQGIEDRL